MADTSGYVQTALEGARRNDARFDDLRGSIRNLGNTFGERRVRKEDAAERQLIRDTEAENLAMDRKREKEIADLADKYNAFASLMEFKQQADDAREFAEGNRLTEKWQNEQNEWEAGQNKLQWASQERASAREKDPLVPKELVQMYSDFVGLAKIGITDPTDPVQYEKLRRTFIGVMRTYNEDVNLADLTEDEVTSLEKLFDEQYGLIAPPPPDPRDGDEVIERLTNEKGGWNSFFMSLGQAPQDRGNKGQEAFEDETVKAVIQAAQELIGLIPEGEETGLIKSTRDQLDTAIDNARDNDATIDETEQAIIDKILLQLHNLILAQVTPQDTQSEGLSSVTNFDVGE